MNNLEFWSNKIKKANNRHAIGHEYTLSFNLGYINALFSAEKITMKEKKALHKVYSNCDNDFYRYTIENGKLIDNGEDS